MEISQLVDEFWVYWQDSQLFAETNLTQRAQALALIKQLQQLPPRQQRPPDFAVVLEQAAVLEEQIKWCNQQLFSRIRNEIQQGGCRGERFLELLHRFCKAPAIEPTTLYFQQDDLDILINGILELDNGPTTHQALAAGMVHYERTPVRAILALVERVHFAPQQIFYDIGSGLGEVPILVHLLTGVQTQGVEIEAEFCRFARQQSAALRLTDVTIVNADARLADYSDGDIFFMFTPFYGAILQAVLARLQQQAQQRPLLLCTYGPCTPVVAQEPWLAPLVDSLIHEFALTIFRTL